MSFAKVSIITVCYNSEKTIEQTIFSVLNQTYSNIEYIIIDGGSQDCTLDIIKKYGDRIQLISEIDDGIFHAMNKGIMKASGDIIGIINSDDWYEDYAVDLAVQFLNEADCDLVYGWWKNVFDNGVMSESKSDILENLRYRMVISHPTVFVKKVIYEKYGIFNQQYAFAADYDLMLRFYECGVKMVEIPRNLAYFRMSGKCNTQYGKTINEVREIALKHWDGQSVEIKEKIEKYSRERYVYANFQRAINIANRDLRKFMVKIFPQERAYVIFGAGSYGARYLQVAKYYGIEVEAFVDNDSKKWGEKCGDIMIEAPSYLKNSKRNIIVANVYHKEEIRKQLEDMEYQFGIDFVFIDDIVGKVVDES